MASEIVKQWMIKAQHDLLLAQHELERNENEIVTDGVCFHCQQCAEKSFKAFLISKNSIFPRTHDLESLLKQCIVIDSTFEQIETGMLTGYAIEVRYPDDFYLPDIPEAREAYRIAKTVYEFINGHF
ncbi:MAG: hypothetical protein A2014_07360 [Spirochaetes bacterium GWF1_49_6]|nr:MAG: hypothetical protein A2014_07360 [Spirochaetes bacterium GWF1_49_6]